MGAYFARMGVLPHDDTQQINNTIIFSLNLITFMVWISTFYIYIWIRKFPCIRFYAFKSGSYNISLSEYYELIDRG
ncbi:hypothetical protein Hanom_Chr05g00432471 [Helianthus anomalus]